jgi:hypothetical protein
MKKRGRLIVSCGGRVRIVQMIRCSTCGAHDHNKAMCTVVKKKSNVHIGIEGCTSWKQENCTAVPKNLDLQRKTTILQITWYNFKISIYLDTQRCSPYSFKLENLAHSYGFFMTKAKIKDMLVCNAANIDKCQKFPQFLYFELVLYWTCNENWETLYCSEHGPICH